MKFCVNAALSLVSDPGVLCTDFCRAALLRSCLSINLCPDESEIRHNLLHVLDVGLVKNRGLTQISLPLGGLLGQDVALISFEPLDLAGAGHFETLSSGSFGLHLRHLVFLLVIAHIVRRSFLLSP